jgi:uncharacterized protein
MAIDVYFHRLDSGKITTLGEKFMEKVVENFIACNRIAVVGVSHNPNKFGNMVYKELKGRGYQVYAVNPTLKEIEGEPCYPNLTALQGKVDGVVINVSPARASDVLREASSVGMSNIWLQQGSDSAEVLQLASELGLHPVTKKCILMYAQPVRSFHSFHRLVMKMIGQL